jgi:hypothetical protein
MESTWDAVGGAPTPPVILHRLESASRAGCRPLLNISAAVHWLPLTIGVTSIVGVTVSGHTARVCISEGGPTRISDFPTHGSLVLAAYPVVWRLTLRDARWRVLTLHDVGLCPRHAGRTGSAAPRSGQSRVTVAQRAQPAKRGLHGPWPVATVS